MILMFITLLRKILKHRSLAKVNFIIIADLSGFYVRDFGLSGFVLKNPILISKTNT